MFRQIYVIIAAFVALADSTARAQSVSGTVKSGGHPVAGVTVRLLELERAERTGAQGQFTFHEVPSGNYTIFVSVSGYASATKKIDVTGANGATASASFELKPSAMELKEIVVSASPEPRTAADQYQSVDSKSQTSQASRPVALRTASFLALTSFRFRS